MNDIPDAPWIQRAELYGDPWYNPYLNGCDDEDYEEEEDYEVGED